MDHGTLELVYTSVLVLGALTIGTLSVVVVYRLFKGQG